MATSQLADSRSARFLTGLARAWCTGSASMPSPFVMLRYTSGATIWAASVTPQWRIRFFYACRASVMFWDEIALVAARWETPVL